MIRVLQISAWKVENLNHGRETRPLYDYRRMAPNGNSHIFLVYAKKNRGLTPSTHNKTPAFSLYRYSINVRSVCVCCHPVPVVCCHPVAFSTLGNGSIVTRTVLPCFA